MFNLSLQINLLLVPRILFFCRLKGSQHMLAIFNLDRISNKLLIESSLNRGHANHVVNTATFLVTYTSRTDAKLILSNCSMFHFV
jgi:hypothetical protein